jgi:hypothetical protein
LTTDKTTGSRVAIASSHLADERPEGQAARSASTPRTLGRRRLVVWSSSFASVLILLVLRNVYLFHTRIYENGDFAANSVIIGQAKHFSLLTGNYSRLGFMHPGPFWFYVQAAGEWLFHDLLGVVPTPYNGQLLAIFILNAALIATVVAVVDAWTRSLPLTALCGAAILALIAIHPMVVDSSWMPWAYCPAYLLLAVSAASVAAGRGEDLPLVALAGSMLVHGHVSFLAFVPAVAIVALASMFVVQRRIFGAGVLARHRKHLLVALAVIALFLVPIVVNLILHWPGEFVRYRHYQDAQQGHHHSLREAVRYALQYWVSGPAGSYVFGLVTAAAAIGCVTMPKGAWRRLCIALITMSLFTTLFVIYYARVGIDNLQQPYIAFFAYFAPAPTVIALLLSVASRVPRWLALRPVTAVAVGVLAAAVVGVLVTPIRNYRGDPGLSAGVAAITAHTAGRPALLNFTDHDSWPDGVGLLVLAKRQGIDACVTDAGWSVLVRPQSICTAAERANGVTFDVQLTKRVAPSVPRLATMRWTILTQAGTGPGS